MTPDEYMTLLLARREEYYAEHGQHGVSASTAPQPSTCASPAAVPRSPGSSRGPSRGRRGMATKPQVRSSYMSGIRTRVQVDSGATTETAPAGNRGLTNATDKESTMAESQSIHIPPTRAHERKDCGKRSPHARICNRPAGHTGRHSFSWRHLDGRVREVWA